MAATLVSLVCLATSTPAHGAVAHVVVPGETLTGIAAVNGLSAADVAAWNGLPAEYFVIAGETIYVPSLAEAGVVDPALLADPAAPAAAPVYGLATISGPMGSVQLDSAAAVAFESMRADSLAQFGIDLFPDGSLSGYRTYEQQAYLYDLFLSGPGRPRTRPGHRPRARDRHRPLRSVDANGRRPDRAQLWLVRDQLGVVAHRVLRLTG